MAVARGDRINGDFEYLINGSARFAGLWVFIVVSFLAQLCPFCFIQYAFIALFSWEMGEIRLELHYFRYI